jgi:hypothetical protein
MSHEDGMPMDESQRTRLKDRVCTAADATSRLSSGSA